MSDPVIILPRPLAPAGAASAPRGGTESRGGTTPFSALLDAELKGGGGLRFSRHALSRIESRGIAMGPAELQRVEAAVAAVEAKGGKDSLVLLDDTALVVSVKNQTVVTVVDRDSLQGNVFTQIDSAVIA